MLGSPSSQGCWAERKARRASTPPNYWTPAEAAGRLAPKAAVLLGAVGVEGERVPVQLEAALPRNLALAPLDIGIVELLDPAALQADEVVVMSALVELVHRLAGLEVLPRQEPGVLELGQRPVHGGQADIDAFGEQRPVDVLGGKVAYLARLEELQDLAPRQRRLQAASLQALRAVHSATIIGGCCAAPRSATLPSPRSPRPSSPAAASCRASPASRPTGSISSRAITSRRRWWRS